MQKKVLITEKPSVAMEFAKAMKLKTVRKDGYLESEKWYITWCVGHLITMSYPEKYNPSLKFWKLETLPFLPQKYKYEVIPNVSKQFKIVKEILNKEDVETIYVCTDSGREGEYIYRLVDEVAEVEGKIKKRVWIDSQTEEEILRGIKEAKDLSEYDSLSDSAYLRAKEDYLIGINFSRLLTLIYGDDLAKKLEEEKTSISIGRVMTCVLGMIVEKEREILDFKKTKYYKLQGIFGEDEKEIDAEWRVSENSKYFDSPKLYNESGFKNKKDVEELMENLKNKEAIIKSVTRSKQKELPPLLFNLAEIQNECTKTFKIKPDETLDIIQTLYEKKLVTYPRTDARVLSTSVAKEIGTNLNGLVKSYKDEEIQSYLKTMIEKEYKTDLTKTKFVNDKKITDHYAIIPTGQGLENLETLNEMQKDIYKLIVKRFISIFYPAAEYTKINIELNIENELFITSTKVCNIKGYLEISDSQKKVDVKKEKEEELKLELFKTIKKGEQIEVKNFEIKESETSPPTRYSSGTIILAMENAGKFIEEEELREQIKGAGIGTSATRAEIIKKLEKINYININSKTQIVRPSKKGEMIYDIVYISIPDMLNPKLTASWEKGLEMVTNKEITSTEFMKKLEKYVKLKINRCTNNYFR